MTQKGSKQRTVIMTDKEIDVTKCMCYENAKCLWTKRYYAISFCPNCEDVKACYFKQLKRKEQALDEIEKIISGNYETLDPLAKQQISNIISKIKGR